MLFFLLDGCIKVVGWLYLVDENVLKGRESKDLMRKEWERRKERKGVREKVLRYVENRYFFFFRNEIGVKGK